MSDRHAQPSPSLPTLGEIRARVLYGSILPASYYTSIDSDAALDSREADKGLDAGWSHLFEQVASGWELAAVEDGVDNRIAAIRREAHDIVSRATRGHEIAAYVADDLELIARGVVLGRDDPLLVWLWRAYAAGQFPMP